MKNFCGTLVLAAALTGGACIPAALAAPPTVVPSPGYDARLQEQRAASRAAEAPVVKPRRVKKPRAH